MPGTTPFHERLVPLNETGIWKNWSGYLVAPRYQYSVVSEYYAIRNSVAVLDTSPLFKYRIAGSDARAFLRYALARDIGPCRPGQAQYSCWCDEAGFVIQDGVVLCLAEGEYWLTAAEPSLWYFQKLAGSGSWNDLEIDDLSTHYGILALQGPHALDVLDRLTGDAEALEYFEVTTTAIEGTPVVVSRTGFTGDLGYEIWIPAADAIKVWDAIFRAGEDWNIMPLGTTALKMARVEAGLLLMDVDFHSSRFAWVDAQRETPCELGWQWMFRGAAADDRSFVGRDAIVAEMANRTSRWTSVGLDVDWHDYERIYVEAGIMPPRDGIYCETTRSIYRIGDRQWDYAGYASSFLYSSLLRRPVAIAKLPLDLARPGIAVDLELTVIRRPVNVLAHVTRMPFYNPPQKTASMKSLAGEQV